MYLFQGPALYRNVKGVLKIALDYVEFEYSSNGGSFKREFPSDRTLFEVSKLQKSRVVKFKLEQVEYPFTILEEGDSPGAFEKCLKAASIVVDPIAVARLRGDSSSTSLTRDSSLDNLSYSDSQSDQSSTGAPNDATPENHSRVPPSPTHATRSQAPPTSTTSPFSTQPPTGPAKRPTTQAKKSDFYLYVEVRAPEVQGDVATYLVEHRTNMPEYSIVTGEVRRRYSQFEALHAALTAKYSTLSSVPPLPVKAWFKRFDQSFLEQRAQELNKWIKLIALDDYMYRSPELVRFLTDQAPVSTSGPVGYMETLIKPFVDNQIVANIGDAVTGTVQSVWSHAAPATSPTSSSGAPVAHLVGSPLERDYYTARSLMEQWKLTPKKLPFPKFVTLLLGSTSSGKSAFVNHHFGCVVRKSTDHQQDTDFTVVEVIPAAEFFALAGSKEKIVHKSQAMLHPDAKVIESDQFQRPIDDYESDWRTGRVFIRLNSNQLLARYEQLKPYVKDGLFRACLINEAALDRTAPYFELACNSILIDSPGFSTIQSAEIAEKFRGTLVVLQYLYNMCDLLLYFVPCGQISTLAQHLPMLELALTYANHGERIGDEMLKTLFSKELQEAKSTGGFLSFCSSIASSIMAHATYGYSPPSTTQDNQHSHFKGASVWHKTLFILSKVDILFRQTQPSHWHRILLSQYYELGVLLGSSLSLLDAPVHDQCLTIGLPEFQKGLTTSKDANIAPTADLELLTAKMHGREQEAPYIERLEMAIQQMCNDLEKAMANSFMTMGAHPAMLELRKRSETRNRARQTGLYP